MKKFIFLLFCFLVLMSGQTSAAEKFGGKNAQEWLSSANSALYQKNYGKALSDAANVLLLDTKIAEAYFIRGASYAGLGIYHQAIIEYSDAILLNDKNERYFSMRAIAYIGRNIYDEALADLNTAITLSPSQAYLYQRRGYVKKKMEQYQEAIADFDAAISLNNRDYTSYFEKADACYTIGLKEDAIRSYRAFLEYAPANMHRYFLNKAKTRIEELSQN